MTPWKRKEVIGDCELYLGDCREIMPLIGRPDAIVTDPPYGMSLGKRSGGWKNGRHRQSTSKTKTYHIIGDDEPFDPAHLLVADRLVIWGGNHFASSLPPNRKWLVWDKRAGGTPDAQADCELAWTNLPGPERMHVQLWRGMVRTGEENVSKGSYRNHPAQKPVALMAFCLQECSLVPGETVLDPYMGTGACGVAAARSGLRYIGVEIDVGYFEIACDRIRQVYAQPSMFMAPIPAAEQLSMLDGAE